MTPNSINSATESEPGYGQLLQILVHRRFWFLGVFAAALAAAALVVQFGKPVYRSSMQLLVEPNYEKAPTQANQGSTSDRNYEVDYATQINLMRSDQFIERAADLLRSDYPHISADDLKNSITLSQVKERETGTKIFEIVYVGEDPDKTEQVLQAIQSVYEAYNAAQRKLRLDIGLEFIDQQLADVREDLAASQAALERFRQRQALINPEKESEALSQSLAALQQQRQQTEAQYREIQAQYQTLQRQLSLATQPALTDSRLSQSPRYQELLNALQQTELQLATYQGTFTENSPVINKLVEQRNSQLTLLRQEVQRILGTVPPELDLNNTERLLQAGQMAATDQKITEELAIVQTQLSGLLARRQELARMEQALLVQFSRFPGVIAEYDRLDPNIESQRNILQKLLEQRQQLSADLERGGFNWQVVEAPRPAEKISPKPLQIMLLGAVAGVFLGVIAAFIREAMDGTVHTSTDLKKRVDLPLLGILPELRRGIRLPGSSQPSVLQWLPFRESLDLILKNIQLLNSSSHLKSLAVTSALPNEGKSTFVLGLALSAARSHCRVLIIDADLRYPVLHHRLGLPNEHGLSTILRTGRVAPGPTQVSLLDVRIDVLTAGPSPADPVRLLSSQRMADLMRRFESAYDLVLLDTPPILGIADTLQIASLSQGVVMVGRLDRVTHSELIQATTMLSQLNVLGIVANGVRDYPTYYHNSNNGHKKTPVYSAYQPAESTDDDLN
jgi:capsular exopolysaccharide synthesis family protein